MKKIILASVSLFILFILSVTVVATPFFDTAGHWAENDISYAFNEGLMKGMGDGSFFAPDIALTRAMAVTVFYRNEGTPEHAYRPVFIDVPENEYYSNAVIWAMDSGIVSGTGLDSDGEPLFSPNEIISRQELIYMFRCYAVHKNVTIEYADISGYPDASEVSPFGREPMCWAVKYGLVKGKLVGGESYLSPQDMATRAEIAVLIRRYNETTFPYYDWSDNGIFGKAE